MTPRESNPGTDGQRRTWNAYPEGENPGGWMELSENGWGAVAAWFAGPGNVVRQPIGERTDLVRVSRETADGATENWTVPVTPDDVNAIEDDIDDYLHDGKLPPRPRGFRWFLRLPAAVTDERDFRGRLNAAVEETPHDSKRNLHRVIAAMGDTIGRLYGSEETAAKKQ